MELYDRILSFVDSSSMREYLRAHQKENSVGEWVELVTHAPRSLEEKIEVLQALAEANPEEREYIMLYYEAAKTAWERLMQTNTDDSLLLLKRKGRNDAYGQTGNIIEDAIPVRTFREAVRCMELKYAEEYVWERYETEPEGVDEVTYDPDEDDFEPEPYWFWELSLFSPSKLSALYTFVCTNKGEIQYFRTSILEQYHLTKSREEKLEAALVRGAIRAFAGGEINLCVPYQPGDILYIDCRPYSEPTWCVITEIGVNFDCCAVRCLSPVCCGLVREAAFKHDHCFERYPTHDWSDDYISPLFRAEIYEGELPEEYAYLEKISHMLKANPAMGEKIFDYADKVKSGYFIKLAIDEEDERNPNNEPIDGMKPEDLCRLIENAEEP